ncbi:hypothetical protein GGQ73_001838 [Rhizobium skierniewicense]|uniref:Uncharacterized protein n=1 Tax=Rhizobium skierniewicense TaxID=984260 RepID=A0A7W6G1F2_9HYPH|nr:hypothetical protein [Rhizobium skierniewicense]MBB3945903.1 hypothetical protein [Rhizobium skierniewicense]
MSIRHTINELQKVASVQDELMRQLEDDLRELQAARDEIDTYLHKAIAVGADRTAMMVEAQAILKEAHSKGGVFRFPSAVPRLRVVQ